MTAPLYYATGLEQIAQLFDRQRDQAMKFADRSATKRAREIQSDRASVWREAADILRSTSLTVRANENVELGR